MIDDATGKRIQKMNLYLDVEIDVSDCLTEHQAERKADEVLWQLSEIGALDQWGGINDSYLVYRDENYDEAHPIDEIEDKYGNITVSQSPRKGNVPCPYCELPIGSRPVRSKWDKSMKICQACRHRQDEEDYKNGVVNFGKKKRSLFGRH